MVCVHCGAKTHIVNSRRQIRSNQVWRRRKCWDCSAVFTTCEMAHYDKAWVVKKASGALEAFNRDKLLISLYKSCAHRGTAPQDAAALSDTVINKLREHAVNGALDSRVISQVCQVALSRFDGAASAHYDAYRA